MVDTDLVDRPELMGAVRPGLVELPARHMPTASPQRQGDRGPDEPEAGHLGSARRGLFALARAGSVGEVIAKSAGALEIDVVKLASRPLGVKVHQHAHTAGRGAGDRRARGHR